MDWRVSSFCSAGGCVEVRGAEDGMIELRDSKNPDAGVMRYTPEEWDAFLDGVRAGEFDFLVEQ